MCARSLPTCSPVRWRLPQLGRSTTRRATRSRPPLPDQPISVAVIGSQGRMGSEVCRAVEGAADLTLVAAVDVGDDIEALAKAGAAVAVDFTHPDAVLGNLEWCIGHGIHAVVGTTGFD